MTLLFSVKHQTLSPISNQKDVKVVADSKNYLKVKFNFQTPDWSQSSIKYALFTHNGKTYKKILGSEQNTLSNECFVPPEVIKANYFSVSVYCGNTITTNSVDVEVLKSGYTENIENEDITPNTLE